MPNVLSGPTRAKDVQMGVLAISYTEGIESAWADLVAFVPKVVLAVAVFIIGRFVAKAIKSVAEKVLTKIQFNAFVNRSGLGELLGNTGVSDAGALLAKVIYFALMILVLQLTIGTFGDTAVQDALNDMINFIPQLIIAIIIVVLTGVVATKVGEVTTAAVGSQSYGPALTKAAVAGIWLIGGFAALNQVEIAQDIVNVLFTTIAATIGFVIVIMFGVGGIQAARDEFWPKVFNLFKSTEAT